MCFPCCPVSAPANLCPLVSMCSHVVHLRPCLLSVRLFIYNRACNICPYMCDVSFLLLLYCFFTVPVLLSHCVPFVHEVSS